MNTMMLDDKQSLEVAKRELAQDARSKLLQAKLRIMHEDIFPAHMPHQEVRS